MEYGHSTEEWELGCSDPRQDILCTIAGVTTNGDGLAHQVLCTQSLMGYSVQGFILAGGSPLPPMS